ncbi:MAG TPA: hypothetical protein VKA15_19235, partial [Isosphaeraceae bacterium]|nr:hypothetical protein [Isosphaeraceae bacterium]
GISSTTGLVVGETVTGTGIPSGTTIQTINSLTATITLSANATVSGSQSLTASGWIENTEAAWYDPTTGVYTIQGPSTNTNPSGVYTVSAGFQAGDIPVPADYSGSGSTQAVVFRPSTGDFFAAGNPVPIATFAQASGDIPLAAPLSYRVPDPPSTGTGGSTGTGTGSTGTGTGGSTGTGTGGSTGTGSTGTGTGGSTGTGTGGSSGTGSTGTGSGGTGSGSSSGTTSSSPPAQSPTSGNSGTGSHKKKASHPAPKPSHAKKPVKHVQKKATPPAKPKPKVQVHVVSHPAHKVVKVSPLSTSAQKHAHMVDLALQDIHVNLLRKKSHG